MLGERQSVTPRGSTSAKGFPPLPGDTTYLPSSPSTTATSISSSSAVSSGIDYSYTSKRQDYDVPGDARGIELADTPWRESQISGKGAMGARNGKDVSTNGSVKTAGGYEAVEREEPLLHGASNEEAEKGSRDEESTSAGLLLSLRGGPSLRSGGDPSLGPGFPRRVGSINSTQHVQTLGNEGGGDREGQESRDSRTLSNGGQTSEGRGRCKISGRHLVYLCALCSSLCSILLGYDVGVMSGAKEFIQPDLGLRSMQVEIMVGSLNLVAAFGALLAGKTADRLGRKPTIAVACVVFIIGAVLMSASHTFSLLLLGRIITGIGVGCAMVIAPVYITELAPPDIRGMLVSLTDICINLGIVLGFGSTLVCMAIFESDSARWRSMIGIGMVPPALILLCLYVMPESPRWLIARGQDSVARDALTRVLGNEQEAEESLRTISQATRDHSEATWKDVLMPSDRTVKAAVLLGVGLGFFQQASGSEAAVYYTPDVLLNQGWSQKMVLMGNIGVGTFKLGGEVVAFALLDRIGRRPLFIASSTLVTVSLVLVALSFQMAWGTSIELLWLCMFMFTFSLGLGPVTFVVASEILPVAVRGKAMSIVIFVNRLMSGIIASSFQTLEEKISKSWAFYFFAVLSAVSIFFYLKVPETRGRTLEEIAEDLGSSLPPSIPGSRGMLEANGRGGRHVPLPSDEDELE